MLRHMEEEVSEEEVAMMVAEEVKVVSAVAMVVVVDQRLRDQFVIFVRRLGTMLGDAGNVSTKSSSLKRNLPIMCQIPMDRLMVWIRTGIPTPVQLITSRLS
jgi:hypothetical protein